MYQCTVIGVTQSDTVSIHWKVNGISSTSSSWQSYITSTGITVIGAGTHYSMLTIPGEPVLNGTTVRCLASGKINDQFFGNTNSDTLYIQGSIME